MQIDVRQLDSAHRRALEEVIGRELQTTERLIINVVAVPVASNEGSRPPQTLDDWTHVYDGLSDGEVEAIDQVIKTRANLFRDLP